MHKIWFYIFAILFIISTSTFAQDRVQSRPYPQTDFINPLELTPSTAGTFGELRPNHFHAGLDFRTNQRTGYPVHAAMYGYVSRIKVQLGGFGNAVYLTHPNGYTTVYGHLERFAPELLKALRYQQSKTESFDADFKLQPFQIPVYKGQVIAWSGNTGASGGPHVHFEVRDSATEETINPQLFNLAVTDHVKPVLYGMCVYHLNGAPFSEKTFREMNGLTGANGTYHLAGNPTLQLSGSIGFGIIANDMNSTSANRNGVYSVQLNMDGKTVFTYAVERFAFDQTHAINALVDYPQQVLTHRFIQKSFILPGSNITLYPQSVNRGVIDFRDTAVHQMEYVVKDVAGNTSTLTFNVQSSIPKDNPIYRPTGYLMHYNQVNEFTSDNLKVVIPAGNLYDDLDFQFSKQPRRSGMYSSIYRLHNKLTPIHDGFQVWIKPEIDFGSYADKAMIIASNGGTDGNVYEDGYIKATAHAFGDFYIKLDTIPPVITPVNIRNGSNLRTAKTIAVRMSDNLSGIKTWKGKIDGKWVLMEWTYHNRIPKYTFDSSIAPGKHTFEFTATDFKNNTSTFTAEFYR
ncbi:M23 family metallopeptidase [Mucilaginibacter koreensis]